MAMIAVPIPQLPALVMNQEREAGGKHGGRGGCGWCLAHHSQPLAAALLSVCVTFWK